MANRIRLIVAACFITLLSPQVALADCPSTIVLPVGSTLDRSVFISGLGGTSIADLWAVGAIPPHALIEHYNGATWVKVPAPSDLKNDALSSVAASSPTNAWAVGARQGGIFDTQKLFVLHWNGSTWVEVKVPDPSDPDGTPIDVLTGVAVNPTNASDVWAVGVAGETGAPSDRQFSIAEHWDGNKWHLYFLPGPNQDNSGMLAVSVSPTGHAWAVGEAQGHALVDYWNGSGWIEQTPASGPSILQAVTAASDTDVWALGGPRSTRLAEHFDGTRWSNVPTPPLGSATADLTSVVEVSPTDVWAAGDDQPISSQNGVLSLIEHFDGTSWSVVPSESGGVSTFVNGLFPFATGLLTVGSAQATPTSATFYAFGTIIACTSLRSH